jgi:hypothetical protein
MVALIPKEKEKKKKKGNLFRKIEIHKKNHSWP